ncbi:6740_t:CDS:2 [Funneliformis geosporum]|uniref:6740_t:CDS:1 n=1 Tax=Funneliformis geosporum TaxID=1117311 RepID=A0A9W4T1D2_9GLOM|nr:6740_t:CDS:2 [Funneliformis geosporum]
MNNENLYEDLLPPVEELLLGDDHSSNFENIISEDSIINQDILEPGSDPPEGILLSSLAIELSDSSSLLLIDP